MAGTILPMRRLALKIGVLVLTFFCGVAASGLLKLVFRQERVVVCRLGPGNVPRFVAEGSLIERDYHIYWYRQSTTAEDVEEITLFSDFRSAQVTRDLFESNMAGSSSELIESGLKLDGNGRQIGRRGVISFKHTNAVRIFWTDGDTFWAVQAPSLELAREFERSDVARSITRSKSNTADHVH